MASNTIWHCSCYAISDGTGNVKIGVAKNIERRMKAIQTGNAHPLQLLFEVECCSRSSRESASAAYAVEHAAHKELHDKRMYGEWFAVEYIDCYYALEQAIDTVAQLWWFEKYEIDTSTVLIHTAEQNHIWYWPTSDVLQRGLVE